MTLQGARRTRADGDRTRQAVLHEAVAAATVDGLDGLTIGTLAARTGTSKSGLHALFGSKEGLQLATVEEAARIFTTEVVQPALAADPGLDQLVAFCDAYLDHLERRVFPGGCFFAGAALEMGSRHGPVQERVAEFQGGFVALVRGFAATARRRGQLPPGDDAARLAFELNGFLLAANTNLVLFGDPAVLGLARDVVRRRLGVRPPRRRTSHPGISTSREFR